MRLLGQILLVCLVISALQGLLVVLAVGIVLVIIWGLIWRPAETLSVLLFLLFLRALEINALGTIGISLAVVCSVLIASHRNRLRGGPERQKFLLPKPSDDD